MRLPICLTIVILLLLNASKAIATPSLKTQSPSSWLKGEFQSSKKFGSWLLLYRREGTTRYTCHAINRPARTTIYSDIRQRPYIFLHYLGDGQFSISGYPGFAIDTQSTSIIYVNGMRHSMKLHRDFFYQSPSRASDIRIIRDMFMDRNEILVTYNRNRVDDMAIDYYRLNGLKEVMRYMTDFCNFIYTR